MAGHSYAEIARVLGVSRQAIREALSPRPLIDSRPKKKPGRRANVSGLRHTEKRSAVQGHPTDVTHNGRGEL
jgi:Zn-dependent peptidase ImmA (M78 family)